MKLAAKLISFAAANLMINAGGRGGAAWGGPGGDV